MYSGTVFIGVQVFHIVGKSAGQVVLNVPSFTKVVTISMQMLDHKSSDKLVLTVEEKVVDYEVL